MYRGKKIDTPTKSILGYFKDASHLVSGHYVRLLINCFIYTILIVILPITVMGFLIIPALLVSNTKIFFRVCERKMLCIGDSLSYGFREGRLLKSLKFYTLSILARILVLFPAVILFFSILPPPLTGFWKQIFIHPLPLNTPSVLYLAVAAIALLILLSFYLSLIWGFGLYFLAEEKLSHTITVKDMFLQSHKIVQAVGLWRLIAIDLIIATFVFIISKVPIAGPLLVLIATPLTHMVNITVYLHNKKANQVSQEV